MQREGGSVPETNPLPTARAYSKGWLRPAASQDGRSATLQSHRVPCPAGYGTHPLHH